MESTQVLDYDCSAYSSHELRTYFCYLQTHLTDTRDNGRIESRDASFFTTQGVVFEEMWQIRALTRLFP
jgi:hypothetical protein